MSCCVITVVFVETHFPDTQYLYQFMCVAQFDGPMVHLDEFRHAGEQGFKVDVAQKNTLCNDWCV